jgi:hypothetical protein
VLLGLLAVLRWVREPQAVRRLARLWVLVVLVVRLVELD